MIEELVRYVRQWAESRIPGFLRMLDNVCMAKYGKKFVELLIENPKEAYEFIKQRYGGDEASADFALVSLILKPIAIKLGRPGLEYELLELVKRGDAKSIRMLIGIKS